MTDIHITQTNQRVCWMRMKKAMNQVIWMTQNCRMLNLSNIKHANIQGRMLAHLLQKSHSEYHIQNQSIDKTEHRINKLGSLQTTIFVLLISLPISFITNFYSLLEYKIQKLHMSPCLCD